MHYRLSEPLTDTLNTITTVLFSLWYLSLSEINDKEYIYFIHLTTEVFVQWKKGLDLRCVPLNPQNLEHSWTLLGISKALNLQQLDEY